jgi:SRSO17 transposase
VWSVWSGWLEVVMSIISPVFGQARSRKAAFAYVQALLRADGRRSCWQLAELAGHASPRRLQALLADYVWDAQVLAERVRAFLLDALADPEAVLAIDETAELKAGSHTVAVAPQYAGITGQVENCQTVVFLAYVTARAHALMDFMLYLPKTWVGDLDRRTRAQVPDQVGFATKPQLAIDLLRRAVAGSVPFAWIVADEVYCATRRLVVSPAQPGGTRREVSGSDGLPGTERIRGQEHARKATVVFRRRSDALRDPRDMAKAGLPEP